MLNFVEIGQVIREVKFADNTPISQLRVYLMKAALSSSVLFIIITIVITVIIMIVNVGIFFWIHAPLFFQV
jgi:hypothetical protein